MTDANVPVVNPTGLAEAETFNRFAIRITWQALVMSAPTYVMFLTSAVLNLFCIAMIGQHGTDIDLAVMGLSNVFCNVTGFSMIWGLASALDTLSSQAFGAKSYLLIGVYLQRSILLVSLLGVLPIVAIWVFASPILLALGQDPEVVKGVQLFAMYRIPGLIALTVFIPFSKTLTSIGHTGAVGGCSMAAAVLSGVVAFLLLVQFDMGVRGAAVVQSAREIMQMIFLLVAALRDAEFRQSWSPWSRAALQEWWPFLKLSIPAMVMQNVEWWSWEIVTFESGLLSADILATQTVLANVANVSYFLPLALSYSTTVLVGQFLGAQDVKSARKCAALLVVDTLALLLLFVGAVVLARRQVGEALAGSVSDTVVVMMPMCAIFSLLDGMQCSLTGVVKGTGQQRIFAPVILICYWVVAVPVGYMFAFHFDLKLYGLWYGMMIGAGLHSLSYAIMLKTCVSFQRAADEAVARLREPAERALEAVVSEELGKPLLNGDARE